MTKYARWNNALARGDRTASITITTTLGLNGGTVSNFIDGGFASNFTDSVEVNAGQSSKEIKFVFSVPKMITGFVRYYSNGSDASTWKLQGSADDVTYVDITGAGAPLGSVGNTYYLRQNSTGANDGYYLYYKLVQTSGTTSSSPYQQEIEFLIVDQGATDNQAAITPDYGSFQGSGDRRAYIIMGGDVVFTAEKTKILDGTAGDTAYFNSGQTGKYLEFDFGTEVLITELSWAQSGATSQGTWKWQKDTGGGTWVDVGSTFTLGSSATTVVTAMSGETGYYKKYRLQQVSGSTSSGPFIREVTFKLGYPAITSSSINQSVILDWKVQNTISQSTILDWKITNFLYQSTILDWKVQNYIYQSFILDYELEATITQSLTLDWNLPLLKSLILDAAISERANDFFASDLVTPGLGSFLTAMTISSGTGTVIDAEPVFGSASAAGNVDHAIAPEIVAHELLSFFGDFYYRIWLDPSIRRLSNPRIGVPVPFNIWNAYPRANSLASVVNIDLTGVAFDSTPPVAFDAYEYKTLTFTIGDTAPATLNGFFDMTFDEGEALLQVIATVVDLLRVLPDEPVTESWSWKTVIQRSWNAREQRMSYRDEPRIRLELNVHLIDETLRLRAYRQLYSFIARELRMPFFHYSTPVVAVAAIGASIVYIDPAATDLREDEFAALWNPQAEELTLVKVATINADHVVLEAPLDIEVGEGWLIIPTVGMRIPDGSGLSMRAVEGGLSIRAESLQYRTILRPDETTVLTTFDGFNVLDPRPIAAADINETFAGGVEVADNEGSLPILYTAWDTAFVTQAHQWKVERPEDMDFWRKFLKAAQGMQNPFLVATWRDDLPLIEVPDLGGNLLVTSLAEYAGMWEFDTYKRIQIETQNGILYRKVTAVTQDSSGNVTLTLATNLGVSAGDNVIRRISFLNVSRLDSDEVLLMHYVNWTIIALSTRTINE